MNLRDSMRPKAAKRSQKLLRVVQYNAWDLGDRVPLEERQSITSRCRPMATLAMYRFCQPTSDRKSCISPANFSQAGSRDSSAWLALSRATNRALGIIAA